MYVAHDGRVGNAGGFVVQLLPGVSDSEADQLANRVRALGPVTSRLLTGDRPADWLNALFPEGYQVLDTTAARFHCGCSQERVETALKLLGADEIRRLLDHGRGEPASLTCEFCRAEYRVAADTLAGLLREVEREATT